MKRLTATGLLTGLLALVSQNNYSQVLAPSQFPVPLKLGSEFQPEQIRSLQRDEFANPAMLWVTRGQQLWSTAAGASGKSCQDCHQAAEQSMRNVATRYPRHQERVRKIVNIEGQINACVVDWQISPPLAYESDELLALTAFVASQSRGLPMAVTLDEQTRSMFNEGRRLYVQRTGQLNLACEQCHQANWGRHLLTDTISQGHGTGYPGYRFEWQKIGSLQRRLRACYFGVRAEMPDYGSSQLLALELYLAIRATGLAVEVPGVRK